MKKNSNYCLITGASRGLGKVLAEHFWDQGWNLILLARDQQALNAISHNLGKRPNQNVHTVVADLSQLGEVKRIASQIELLAPEIDTLINNAGTQGPIGPSWENDWAEWQKTLQVNLIAPVELCRLIAPCMITRGGGSIINLSGGGATGPRANFSAYATAKAALVRFSETLADELKIYAIRVNCIAPGAMKTSMLEEIVAKGETVSGKKEYDIAVRVLREGGASLHNVAELCCFLASPESEGITGKLISAVWDHWQSFPEHKEDLQKTDIYTLRRIVPKDRGMGWGDV